MVAVGRLIFSIFLFLPLIASLGCDKGAQSRPVGYFKLGPAGELARVPEAPFADLKLYLRHDSDGFSVMSTSCTYDRSALTRIVTPDGVRWRSAFTASEYDETGKVLRGPARNPLPFFKLEESRDYYNGTGWALYAKVGEVVAPSWRLKPGVATRAQE